MMRLITKLREFMIGRYGNDELNSFVLWIYFVLIVLNIFIRSRVISAVALLLLLIAVFRALSKKIFMRQRENRIFLSLRDKSAKKIALTRDMIKNRKTNIYRKCPGCGAVIKLPRKKGEHGVRCPKCGRGFKIKCR